MRGPRSTREDPERDRPLQTGVGQLKTGLGRVLWCLGVAGLGGVVVYHACFSPSYFEDDRYNLGVALRSSLPISRYFLETSAVPVFFEPYPIPGPAAGHRGLSIIVLKFWTWLTGAKDGFYMRIPHVVWVALWLVLSAKLLLRLLKNEPSKRIPATGDASHWASLGLAVLLVSSPWGLTELCRAFLDDVPSVVFIVLGWMVVAARPEHPLRLFVGGACLGMAYCTKDFAIIWLPISLCALTVYSIFYPKAMPIRSLIRDLTAVVLGCGVVCLPRLLWDLHDFGTVFENPLRHWIRARYFGPVGGHADSFRFFFLYDDKSYTSAIAMSGGLAKAFARLLERAVPETLLALGQLGFAWIWLVPHFVWWRQGARNQAWFKNGDRHLAGTRFLGRSRGLARRRVPVFEPCRFFRR